MKNESLTFKQNLIRYLPVMVFIYCICQPLMDIATYWQEYLHISNALTVVLRMGLLCGSVLLGFILSDRKRYYYLTGVILGGFLAGHIWACMQAGYNQPFGDLSNMVRIYLLPLTTLCFCTFLRQNGRVVRAIRDGMMVNLGIIILVMILSRLTGTDPYTYPNKELGVRGWFYLPNSQSAILAMIAPVAIGWSLMKWEKQVVPVTVVSALSIGALFALGTRLAFISFIAVGMGMAVCLLLIDRKRWHQSVVIGLVTVAFAAMLPISPMVRNQKAVAGNFEIKQSVFDETAAVSDGATDEERKDALAEAYRLFLPGVISQFGEERTMEAYDFSQDVNVVGNQRLMKRTYCDLLLEDSPESAKWFGMSRSRMVKKVSQTDVLTGEVQERVVGYDPENDFHAIFYLCGGVGLAMMLIFIGFFAARALLAMVRDFKHQFTVDFAALSIGACCAVAHCYFTASILRFNSASVYLAMILAALWYLSRRERSAKRMRVV